MTDQKPWLKQYPEGIPAEIDLDIYHSIVDMAEQAFVQFADHTAYTNFGAAMSYGELDRKSRAFGAYLQSLGFQKGDRVAVMMPNLLQYPVAVFGILRAGLTVVNTNPLYTARELRHQLSDSGARAILVAENFAATVAEVIDDSPLEHVFVTALGDLAGFPKGPIMNFVIKYVKKMVPKYHIPNAKRFKAALKAGAKMELDAPELDHGDVAFLQYTGGTTGVSKGAMLSHGNMVANMLQAMTWLSTRFEKDEQDLTVVTAIPLYHIFALTANCLVFLMLGGRNLLITNPRDMPGFVKDLSGTKFTAITGVNTLFNGLLNTPGFENLDFSSLRLTLGGGMAVQQSVAEHWKKVTGVPLIEAYGLTETSPAACINPMDLQDYNGAIGLPISSTECRVCDAEGKPLPVGEVGELCVRGPQVMQGYWNRPEETSKVLSEDGWLRTGDIARMDEKGYFYIVDRKKDMILVSGFNVYPNEVEGVAATHPGVLEVGAIGVPDDKSGEVVKLVVVRKDDKLTADELREYCRKDLTGYKVPHYIQFVDELPKTNVGKILRRELREQFGEPTG